MKTCKLQFMSSKLLEKVIPASTTDGLLLDGFNPPHGGCLNV